LNLEDYFKDKKILVCGGTGTIGSEIVAQLLKYNPKAIRILSNSEIELWESKQKFHNNEENLRFLLGDIRNYERVKRAAKDVDIIFNAAAVKHVPIGEYNPMEAINVNIHGLENIIEAAFENNVEKLINISTDKAVNPTTVMGATKMLGERLCISRELAKGTNSTIISCVRFGNVLGSRGSIIPLIINQIENQGYVTITDEKMKRFFMSISQAVNLVLQASVIAKGAEIFVLKMPVVYIKDLIEVIIEEYCNKIKKDSKSIEIKNIGARFSEKLDEELISSEEFSSCYELENMYIIYPLSFVKISYSFDISSLKGSKVIVDDNFLYNTIDSEPVNKEEFRRLILDLNLF
jgi:UDP-N-acetylglucosamine 4,6-dehydratase